MILPSFRLKDAVFYYFLYYDFFFQFWCTRALGYDSSDLESSNFLSIIEDFSGGKF